MAIKDTVEHALDQAGQSDSDAAQRAGDKVDQSRTYRAFVTVGLLAYGFVHLLIAWIALQIAWGGKDSGDSASNSGALQELATKPGGAILLTICAVGLFVLVLWQLIEAAVGHNHLQGRTRLTKRLGSAGRAIIYGVIGFTAAKAVTGSAGGGEQHQQGLVAQVMQNPAGRVLIGAIGIGVLAGGIFQIVKGVKQKFTEDLDGAVPDWAKALGTVGYCAKGVAIGIVGILFCWAAISFDPKAAGTTNSALRTLKQQPFGPYLLTLVALGIAAFGLFSFVWAFNARHEAADDSGTRTTSNS